MLDFKDIGL